MHVNTERSSSLNAIFRRLDCVTCAGRVLGTVELNCTCADFVGEFKEALVTCLVNGSTVLVLDVAGSKNVSLASNATTLSAAVIAAPEERDRLLLMWYVVQLATRNWFNRRQQARHECDVPCGPVHVEFDLYDVE